MAPQRKLAHLYHDIPDDVRYAAVMALLVPKPDDWHLLLIQRPTHPKDPHSGQISFPGGGLEQQDQSYQACALRETREEIGISEEKISVIGALTKLYVYASNNLVYPFVGYVEEDPKFVLQKTEVDQVLSVPMSRLINTEIIKTCSMQVRGFTIHDVPYYDIDGQILWGATAMMTSELIMLWKRK